MTKMTTRKAVYAAVAQYSGRDAGHVCYGRTKDEARAKARIRTTMTVAIRRELMEVDDLVSLQRMGKI